MYSKKYRVALVGCGVISDNHLNALTKNENVEIIALCDINTKKAEEKARQYSLSSKVYESYDALLECEGNKLDAIHIATPHYLHASQTLKALERDINVFLEKPLCISWDEIDALIAAEKISKAIACVCFQNRFIPATIAAKKLVDEDGGALSAWASVFWKRGEDYYKSAEWRGRYATEGGGVMINQAIHTIDLLKHFMGTPTSVIATTANHHLKETIEVEDSCEGVIGFGTDRIANFYATTSAGGPDSIRICFNTKFNKIEIVDSCVYLNNSLHYSSERDDNYIGKSCYGNGHFTLINKFYEAIEKGEESPVPIREAVDAVKIILAAYKSEDKKVILN